MAVDDFEEVIGQFRIARRQEAFPASFPTLIDRDDLDLPVRTHGKHGLGSRQQLREFRAPRECAVHEYPHGPAKQGRVAVVRELCSDVSACALARRGPRHQRNAGPILRERDVLGLVGTVEDVRARAGFIDHRVPVRAHTGPCHNNLFQCGAPPERPFPAARLLRCERACVRQVQEFAVLIGRLHRAARIAGRKRELHVAPGLAGRLKDLGLVHEAQLRCGRVEKGGITGAPPGLRTEIADAQLGFQ